MSKWIALCLWIGVCLSAGGVGAWFTGVSVKTWYPTLLKPAGTPPSWVFGPVWSSLYVLMGTAAWFIWEERLNANVATALAVFVAQLAVNAAWSFLFFALRQPGLALIEIVALLAAIVLTMATFAQFSRPAFWLLTPYLGWVLYATYLNFGIWRLNRGAI